MYKLDMMYFALYSTFPTLHVA